MGRYNILFQDISEEKKVEQAKEFVEQVKIINKFIPFKYFELSEVSYGYKDNDNEYVYYRDYPYPNIEKGKIVDVVNLATRGKLPEYSKLPNDIYKNLDIIIAEAFEKFRKDEKKFGYVLYEFIPNPDETPIISDIKTNIKFITEDKLRKYFFVIYHCTDLNYDLEKIFLKEPALEKDCHHDELKKYLFYFNSKETLKLSENSDCKEVITCAFMSKRAMEILPKGIDSERKIEFVYNAIIKQLRYVHSHSRKYHELHSDLYRSENEKNRIIASYNILHPLKHRLGQLSQTAAGLQRTYNEGPCSERTKNAILICKNEIYSTHKFAELAYLSYFTSVSNSKEVYSLKDDDGRLRFAKITHLNLSELIIGIFDKIKNIRINYPIEYQLEQLFSFNIQPYFNIGNNQSARLADYIYEAILLEIINNFAEHSGDDEVRKLYINAKDFNSITFSNKHKNTDNPKIYSKAAGGIGFVSDMLEKTQSGSVKQEIVDGNYEITITFEGLSWKQK